MLLPRARASVLVAAGAAIVVATAGTALSQSPSPPQAATQPGDFQSLKTREVDPRVVESFAIFRRDASAVDAIPPSAQNVLAQRGDTAVGGANATLSRRAVATPTGQVYAVPGDAGLCLVTVRVGAGNGASCGDAGSVAEIGLSASQAATPGSTDRLLQGLAPDGVGPLRFHTASGRSIGGQVVDNGFQAIVPADTVEIEFVGAGRRVPIARPPTN